MKAEWQTNNLNADGRMAHRLAQETAQRGFQLNQQHRPHAGTPSQRARTRMAKNNRHMQRAREEVKRGVAKQVNDGQREWRAGERKGAGRKDV